MVFARDIVPTLPPKEFESFKLIFEKTDEIHNRLAVR